MDDLLDSRVGPVSRYHWVDDRLVEGFSILAACKVAKVSTSSYYDFCRRLEQGPTDATWSEALIVNEICDVHQHLDDTYSRVLHPDALLGDANRGGPPPLARLRRPA
jgi:hypothetical protein